MMDGEQRGLEDDTLDDPRESYYLEPGYLYLSADPVVIRTVVGSCVTVCLWDRRRCVGAMNHFLHPIVRERERATPRFGNVATLALIRLMEDAGSNAPEMVAQIFGGATPQGEPRSTLGDRNVEIARKVLRYRGILIASEDVGGHMGRKVVFDTATGHLVTLKVHRLRQGDWLSGMSRRAYGLATAQRRAAMARVASAGIPA